MPSIKYFEVAIIDIYYRLACMCLAEQDDGYGISRGRHCCIFELDYAASYRLFLS